MTDQSDDERRKHRRVAADFESNGRLLKPEEVDALLNDLSEPNMVTLSVSTGKWTRLATVNLSSGGMCVVGSLRKLGDKMPEQGETVFLDLELPDGDHPLKAMAHVAWVVNAGEAGGRLGLEFVKLEVGGQERLDKHIAGGSK